MQRYTSLLNLELENFESNCKLKKILLVNSNGASNSITWIDSC